VTQMCFIIKYNYNKLQVIHQEKENAKIKVETLSINSSKDTIRIY